MSVSPTQSGSSSRSQERERGKAAWVTSLTGEGQAIEYDTMMISLSKRRARADLYGFFSSYAKLQVGNKFFVSIHSYFVN